MNEEVLAGLVAWVDGMSVDEIKSALTASARASSLRDVDTLARFLYAKATGVC